MWFWFYLALHTLASFVCNLCNYVCTICFFLSFNLCYCICVFLLLLLPSLWWNKVYISQCLPRESTCTISFESIQPLQLCACVQNAFGCGFFGIAICLSNRSFARSTYNSCGATLTPNGSNDVIVQLLVPFVVTLTKFYVKGSKFQTSTIPMNFA